MLCHLTHWGRETHICVGKLTIIGSDNGLSPGRRQVIIWTNAGILLIGPLGTNFSETLIAIETFSFKKKHLKMSSGNCRPFCLGLNVLMLAALLTLCEGNPPFTSGFLQDSPHKGPVMGKLNIFIVVSLNKLLNYKSNCDFRGHGVHVMSMYCKVMLSSICGCALKFKLGDNKQVSKMCMSNL